MQMVSKISDLRRKATDIISVIIKSINQNISSKF